MPVKAKQKGSNRKPLLTANDAHWELDSETHSISALTQRLDAANWQSSLISTELPSPQTVWECVQCAAVEHSTSQSGALSSHSDALAGKVALGYRERLEVKEEKL